MEVSSRLVPTMAMPEFGTLRVIFLTLFFFSYLYEYPSFHLVNVILAFP